MPTLWNCRLLFAPIEACRKLSHSLIASQWMRPVQSVVHPRVDASYCTPRAGGVCVEGYPRRGVDGKVYQVQSHSRHKPQYHTGPTHALPHRPYRVGQPAAQATDAARAARARFDARTGAHVAAAQRIIAHTAAAPTGRTAVQSLSPQVGDKRSDRPSGSTRSKSGKAARSS